MAWISIADSRFRQFAAKAGNVGIQRVRLDFVVDAVDGLLQRRPGDGAPHPPQQRLKHEQFAAWKIERLSVDTGFPVADVERKPPQPYGFGRQVRPTAKHGAQPRQQLFDGKRLAEIIVGADVQPRNAIDQFASRREHDHGNADPACSQLARQALVRRHPATGDRAESRRKHWWKPLLPHRPASRCGRPPCRSSSRRPRARLPFPVRLPPTARARAPTSMSNRGAR